MAVPRKHKTFENNIRYNHLLFDSVMDFHAFVDREMEQLSDPNHNVWTETQHNIRSLIKSGSDTFGTPAPQSLSELDAHTFFQAMHLVQEIKPKIKDRLAQYLHHLDMHVMPKPKVAYNDRGLGIFSFDRAAMGLYRLTNLKLHTPIDKTTTQLNVELGRSNLHTAVKNVYGYFDHKNTTYPSLQLYIMAGANINVKGNQMLYVGLACGELVEFLEQRGVAVEVNVMIGSSFSNNVNMAVIRVKRFQDKPDINQLLLLSSDPKYFRYKGFKAIIALSNYFDLTIPNHLGTIAPRMGNDFLAATGSTGFVFEQSYSMEAATNEVKQILETYQKRRIDEKKG